MGLANDLWAEVGTADARNFHRLLHRITAERLAKLLIKHDFDKGRNTLLLCVAGFLKRCGDLGLCVDGNAFKATALGNAGIREMRIKLGAHEIVIIPECRIALFCAPLVIAENNHRYGGPFFAANRAHFRHRDAEGTITRKANDRNIGIADFRADDGGEALTAWPKQAGSEIFATLFKSRVGVADGAIIADIGRDNRLLWQCGLNSAPSLTGG